MRPGINPEEEEELVEIDAAFFEAFGRMVAQ